MSAHSRTISGLHCRECGDGFPLVLVHGYLGGGEQWQRQLDSPPDKIRVIAPCLPGFGDSASATPPQTIEGFAGAMLNFLSARRIVRFFLLGHSMGGMIAQEMTRQAPKRIGALILCGTGALGAIPGRFETMEQSRRRVMADGANKAAMRLPAKWLVEGKNSPHYSFACAIARKAELSAHLAGLSAMQAWDGRAALANIACPTLIIWGNRDRTYDRAQTNTLLKHIPAAVLQIIPNAAHLAHLECPEQFDDILHGFLSGLYVSGADPLLT